MCCKVSVKEKVHVIYNNQAFEISLSGKYTLYIVPCWETKGRIEDGEKKESQTCNFYTTVEYMATDSGSLSKQRVAFHDTV